MGPPMHRPLLSRFVSARPIRPQYSKPAVRAIWQRQHQKAPLLCRYNSNDAARTSRYRHRSVKEPATGPSGLQFQAIDRGPQGVGDATPVDRFLEHLALRDLCRCEQCVDPSTQQRHYAFASIPANIQARAPRLINDTTIEVRWDNDVPGFGPEHVSHYDVGQLVTEADPLARLRDRFLMPHYSKWNAARLARSRSQWLDFDFARYMDTQAALNTAVMMLVQWGIIFVRNVPFETDAVKRILERIGPLRNTFYGETWDVRSVPGAANVAYTARDLGFHQDLLYMANPPGLQALHVMRASATGGESLFADGAHAVDSLIEAENRTDKKTWDMRAFFRFPITYRYKNAGEWYEFTRPTLEGGWRRRSVRQVLADFTEPEGFMPGYGVHYDAINWSPPFQGPFTISVGATTPEKAGRDSSYLSQLQEYRQAAALLQGRLEHPDSVYETRMEPGTCVIFNNRRIMHARKAFPVGGNEESASAPVPGEERWLRGAYGDLDPLMSRYRVIREAASSTSMHLDLDGGRAKVGTESGTDQSSELDGEPDFIGQAR